MSLEIIYDGESEKRSSGIGGFCRIFFHDYDVDLLKFRHEENSSFYIIKGETGKMMADHLSCMHHVVPFLHMKNRKFDLTYLAFWAHPGYINYLGHVTINYKPSGFEVLDLFALGGLKYDNDGKLDFRVEDRADDAVKFLSKNYPELKNIPLTKSFLDDVSKIKPDNKPEAYSLTKNLAPPKINDSTSQPVSAPDTPTTSATESSNPYYTPSQDSQGITYRNPYEKVDQK